MPTLEEGFASWSSNAAALTPHFGSGVNARIYPLAIPQEQAWVTNAIPAVALVMMTFRQSKRITQKTFRARSSHARKYLEIMIWSLDYMKAKQAAQAFFQAFDNYDEQQGAMGGVTVSYCECLDEEDVVDDEKFPGSLLYAVRSEYLIDFVEV